MLRALRGGFLQHRFIYNYIRKKFKGRSGNLEQRYFFLTIHNCLSVLSALSKNKSIEINQIVDLKDKLRRTYSEILIAIP